MGVGGSSPGITLKVIQGVAGISHRITGGEQRPSDNSRSGFLSPQNKAVT